MKNSTIWSKVVKMQLLSSLYMHVSIHYTDKGKEIPKKSDLTTVICLAWCKFSQEFLPELDRLAGHFYKFGELTESIFFAKIDGDRETELAKQYAIDGYPSIYFEQYGLYIHKRLCLNCVFCNIGI